MHFMGMLDNIAPNIEHQLKHQSKLRLLSRRQWLRLRKKEPDSRVIVAGLVGIRMPMHIEEPRMRIRQIVIDYLERLKKMSYKVLSVTTIRKKKNRFASGRCSVSIYIEAHRALEGREEIYQVHRATSGTRGKTPGY